jgi:bifunctional NMN adenylyltransferase/nudix hydrolase
MQVKQKSFSVGVIIGRFQVPELHEAHKELIQSVLDAHPKVLIFLGLSSLRGTTSNPLDFAPRKQMLLEDYPPSKYPNLSIHYIKDQPDDKVWSDSLDALIRENLAPNDDAVLYGSRDSFLTCYSGKFEKRELVATRFVSGSEIRAKIAQAPQSNPFFRAGAIWATHQRYPAALPTVDVIVYDLKENRILLARKANEQAYRIVGGFTSPNDDGYEVAALRELAEETGLTVGLAGLRYVGSKKIDDWRYRAEVDKIITHLYVGYYSFGAPKADDDIAEVRWFDANYFRKGGTVVREHIPLMEMFYNWLDVNHPTKDGENIPRPSTI